MVPHYVLRTAGMPGCLQNIRRKTLPGIPPPSAQQKVDNINSSVFCPPWASWPQGQMGFLLGVSAPVVLHTVPVECWVCLSVFINCFCSILLYVRVQGSVLLKGHNVENVLVCQQGWEFAHRFSEWIACFLPKNERKSDSLKKMSDSLIRSFLVSNLSDSLRIAHFLIRSQKRGNEQIAHFFLQKNVYKTY